MFDELDNEDKIRGIEGDQDFYSSHLPRGYLSVSQVTQYLKCSEAYKRRYINGETCPASTFIVQGRGVHKAAESLHISMMSGTPLSTDEMQTIYSDSHDREIVDAVVTEDEEDPPGVVKDAGIRMTTQYRQGALGELRHPDTGAAYEPIKPIAAERIMRVMLRPANSDPIPFMGVIDLEEETGIADIKTKKRAASQMDADNSMQLTMYAYITGKPVVRLDQLVKPSKTRPARYLRTASLRTKKETLHVVDVVAEVAEDIAAGRFRKTNPENWWCSEKCCSYWGTCRGRTR